MGQSISVLKKDGLEVFLDERDPPDPGRATCFDISLHADEDAAPGTIIVKGHGPHLGTADVPLLYATTDRPSLNAEDLGFMAVEMLRIAFKNVPDREEFRRLVMARLDGDEA